MQTSPVANVYANALLELANEAKALEETEAELSQLLGVLWEDDLIRGYFLSPIVKIEDRLKLLEKSLKGSCSGLLYSFLGVLISKDRFEALPEIYSSFVRGVDRMMNRQHVRVLSRNTLDLKTMERIQKSIEAKTKATCVMENIIKQDLIGGFIVEFEDYQIDGSMKNKLDTLKRNLINRNIPVGAIYED